MFDKQDIKIGQRVKCISNDHSYFTKGEMYKVSYTSRSTPRSTPTLYILDNDMDDNRFTLDKFGEYFELVKLTKDDIRRQTK